MPPSHASPLVSFVVDAGPQVGVGHLMRCLAIAEELTARGAAPLFLGDYGGLPWAEDQLAHRGFPLRPRADDVAVQCRELGVDAALVDGYEISPEVGRSLRADGLPVATMVDGEFGTGQDADLYVDQNYGATRHPSIARDRQVLAGIRYACLGDHVLRQRRPSTAREPGNPPKVLVVFGGTDPFGGAEVLTDCLLETTAPLSATVISSNPATPASYRTLPGQSVEVIARVDDLPALAVGMDLVITAAGTSVWELLSIGVPIGVVCVTENQYLGYSAVADLDVALPLGLLPRMDEATHRTETMRKLSEALLLPSQLRTRARRGQELVDGRGRERVVDALLALMSTSPRN